MAGTGSVRSPRSTRWSRIAQATSTLSASTLSYGEAAASESGALEECCDADGCATAPAAAASPSELAETASGAFESAIGAAGDASGETPSGAFDSVETASGAFESVQSASGAFESDETAAAPSGAFDAVGGVAIGTQAALWPPSQCARWHRAPQ
jgi:hypothetical protein